MGMTKKEIRQWQKMINDGSCWKLEGYYGRTAMSLIESGDCILGKVGHRDYYGNYVPSRFEVKSGTKGSIAYARKLREEICTTGDYRISKLPGCPIALSNIRKEGRNCKHWRCLEDDNGISVECCDGMSAACSGFEANCGTGCYEEKVNL